jgi:DNA-binding GntR family transcriptional regulator
VAETLAYVEVIEQPSRAGRSNDIRATLQHEIEAGLLRPGTPLDERALAARFEVSRTPVREALQQLAVRDLIRITPRQGITVKRISISRLREVLETVAELEVVCAGLAAKRVDDALRQALQIGITSCERAIAQDQPSAYRSANRLFHEAIYAGCKNTFLVEQIQTARSLVQRYRMRDFQTKMQLVQSLKDHVAIADAISVGDETASIFAMRQHLPIGSTGFSEFLANIPASYFDASESENKD